MRAFIAIELTPAIGQRIAGIAAALRARIPAGTVGWVNPGGIHLTLKFLGEVSAVQTREITDLMQAVTAGRPAFEIRVRRLGCFPNPSSPRVVWVGVDPDDGSLAALQEGLERGCEKLGFDREARAFSPHLTLGRVKREARRDGIEALQMAIRQAGEAECGAMEVDRIHLIRSELKPTGAVYSLMATSTLSGSGP